MDHVENEGPDQSVNGHHNGGSVLKASKSTWSQLNETEDGKTHSHDVGLEHLDSQNSRVHELNKSGHLESKENVAELRAEDGTAHGQEHLCEDESSWDDLVAQELFLGEGLLGPWFHCEKLDRAVLDLVGVRLVSDGEVGVEAEAESHSQHGVAVLMSQSDDAGNTQDNWHEVHLEAVEISDIGHVQKAEKADKRVDVDDDGQAHVVVLVGQAHQREVHQAENDGDGS